MTLVSKVVSTLREDGFMGLAARCRAAVTGRLANAYRDRLRPRLPTVGYPRWNGVNVARPRKLFDAVVPERWKPYPVDDDPQYESALAAELRRHVRDGDRVLIVGGGFGVTAVTAARATGPRGEVRCVEAVLDRVRDIEVALRLNRVSAPVHLEHAVAGPAISLLGESNDARIIPPEELPVCDVLELDCEGAEVEILRGLAYRPRVILVETHGCFGAPTAETERILKAMGYVVVDAGVAEIGLRGFCLEHDIRVLVATPPHP
jgi:hypothetical protein